MDADADVRRFMGGPPHVKAHRAEVSANIIDGQPSHRRWAIEWRDRPGFLGQCGLSRCHMPGCTAVTWRLGRAHWGRGIASERGIWMLRRDVVLQRRQVLLRSERGDVVAMHHHVVRRVAAVVVPVVHVARAVAVIVDQVRMLPGQPKDVIVGARAIDHALVHDHQADGNQAAAAHWSDQVG